MRNAHRVAAVRAAEQALMDRLPPGALMQRAAAGLASVCAQLLGRVYGARVVVLAGSGDNGGDALYAGARLARRGAGVVAVAAGSRIHQEGAGALRAAGGRVITPDDPDLPALIAAAGLVLDGLLGIGGRGGLREHHAALAELTERARGGDERPEPPAQPHAEPATAGPGGGRAAADGGGGGPLVVAVDLPSGVDADTGEVAGVAFRADVTVTFGTWKPGLLIDPGAGRAGMTQLVDIGLGPHLPPPDVTALDAPDVADLLPRPGRDSDKYRRGVLGIVAGSERFTGAAALAVGGAIRGGAGMVRLVTPEPAAAVVRQLWPEAVITGTGASLPAGEEVTAAGRVQAWLAGPGMGTDELARRRLAEVLATDLPALVDADGLTLLAAGPGLVSGRAAATLLTPHAGELARLLGADPADVAARRSEHATAAAARLGAWVLLKGSTTVIAPPPAAGGPLLVNTTGTSWLASAGTGDVLSGLTGALLAQRVPPGWAAATAAFLHAIAARNAAAGALAADGGPSVASLTEDDPAAADGYGDPEAFGEAPIGAGDVVRALPTAIRGVRRTARSAG
jgi:ADP-dependent NAD(P)H-hydrate dehydratase / NAD(P)H-hydrate epimerase